MTAATQTTVASRAPWCVAIAVLTLAGCQTPQSMHVPVAKTIQAGSATLEYIDQGCGGPVVLLHGAVSDARIWEPQRATVSAQYRFIAPTMRYFGKREWADDGQHFSRTTHVNDTAAFVRALRAGPVVLVGRSYGASVAVSLTIRHPELVSGLVLNEPGITGAIADSTDRAAVLADLEGGQVARRAAAAGDVWGATRLLLDFVNNRVGEFDALPPAMRAMHMDNARTIRAARHGAPSQQPEAFNRELLAFLRQVDVPGGREHMCCRGN